MWRLAAHIGSSKIQDIRLSLLTGTAPRERNCSWRLRMKSTNDLQGIVGTVLTEIEGLQQEIDLVPTIITKQLNDSSSYDFEFRPLTEKEKKAFVKLLDDKGKQ